MTNIGLIIAIIKVGLMAVGFFNNQYETKAQNDIEESVYEYETESEDENVTTNVDNANGQYALEYGVYLSDEYDELPIGVSCETIVIDAQYYSKEEVATLKKTNGTVLSYLNIGSIEDFRDYYNDYQDLILGPYENWDGEYWIDVSDQQWQDFITEDIATSLINKGVDGFFIDNTDVYYFYPDQDIYNGVTSILKSLKGKNMQVIINGGDTYVSKYLKENGSLDPVLDGVNQESVFSSINWDDKSFEENDQESKDYFLDYLSDVASDGKKVFLLEYTTDESLIQTIKEQSSKLGYTTYISDSLELD